MIYNLTQHQPTPDQVLVGVLPPLEGIAPLLDFKTLDEVACELPDRVRQIALALNQTPIQEGDKVMIGGAPFLMRPLADRLREDGYIPVFAFSQRESADQLQSDGSVKKVAVFRHKGFVPA